MNRQLTATDPLSGTTTFTYDAAARLKDRTDGRGWLTKYFYNDANRLTSLEHWNGTLIDTMSTVYDDAGNRTSMTDATGTTTYAHDTLDRVTSVTAPGTGAVAYAYDAVGNRTQITYPDAKTVAYTYDDANRLATVTDWLTKVTTYAYDNVGNLSSTTLPNGVVTTYGYDNADRLTSLTNTKGTPFSSFTYTLDAVGNRTQMVDNLGVNSYVLDSLHRLTSVTYPGPTTDTYTFDALGNRLTKNATAYTYDDADQLLTVGATSYGYDANGNQTTRGADTFTWDHENRLTQAVVGGVTSSSAYNGDGARVSHTVNAVATTYVVDTAARLPVVLQDGTLSYVYGLDLISSTDGSSSQTYYSYDGLGSTSDLTDGTGTVTDTYAYDVFGAIRASSGSSTQVFLFTGEGEDGTAGDTGYYFLRARYYDPEVGRFPSRDLLEFDQRYAYVGSNPVAFTDPSGLCPWCVAVAVGASGVLSGGTTLVLAGAATAATAACFQLDCGGAISYAAGAVGDSIGTVFSRNSGPSLRNRLQRMESFRNIYQSHAAKVNENPCSQDRRGWETSINNSMRDFNKWAERAHVQERLARPDLNPCGGPPPAALPPFPLPNQSEYEARSATE